MPPVHNLLLLDDLLAVCRLPAEAPAPKWVQGRALSALIRTSEELTVVCPEHFVPPGVIAEPGWRALQVEGPLDFELVGVLASLAASLADAGVSIFAISTYSTDFILIKESQVDLAVTALHQAGHQVRPLAPNP
ncbi:MAG: ACT domain-containing protein [Anaerolineales bacterium]|jgi:hypothetical protein